MDGGETKLSNLVLLRRFHHRLVHEGGFSVEVDEAGRFVFRAPDGMPLDAAGAPRTAPADVVSRLRAATAARGVAIEPDTGVPDWGGEEMDEGLAIFALLHADERGNHVSAETCPSAC